MSIERAADPAHRGLSPGLQDVQHDDRVAGQRSNLSDATAHRPAPKHADRHVGPHCLRRSS